MTEEVFCEGTGRPMHPDHRQKWENYTSRMKVGDRVRVHPMYNAKNAYEGVIVKGPYLLAGIIYVLIRPDGEEKSRNSRCSDVSEVLR